MQLPPDLTRPWHKAVTAQVAADLIAGLCRQHRRVVQAGGCSGLWPMALARKFDAVVTCEPAPSNFAYLVENVKGLPVTAYPYALGSAAGQTGLTRPKPHAGVWRVEGPGTIPVVTIDDLVGALPVDAIVLDVEGSELAAWEGAVNVIATHHPLLWFEGLHEFDALSEWLAVHGYGPPQPGLGADWYSTALE